ncbi:MAG: PAS domain S-box protein, partial [Polyangia bacterium]|nr:PAS domain S-box protein [Polyangia bacterium]
MGFSREDLYRTLVESASTGILVAEEGSRRLVFANPAFCELLGYSSEELLTLSISDLHPAEALEDVEAIFDPLARDAKTLLQAVPCLRKDGSLLHADINTASASIGGAMCILGFFSEATVGRQASEGPGEQERKLRESNQLMEAVLNAIPDLIGVQNPDHTIIRYNEAGYRMLGIGPDEAVGKKCYALIGRDRPCEQCATHEAIRTGEVSSIIKHVPEMGVWLDCRSYPVKDERGKVFRLVEHLRDITERRAMEERLRKSERLQAIGQLAGGVSHDFNNQLGGILGLAELLRDELKDRADLRPLTESILSSVERAANLTSQLLAFARRGKYRSEPVCVHDLLTEIKTLLGRSMDKRIRIALRAKAEHSVVLGDPSQLQSALLNLALNARDAMPEGGELGFETAVVSLDSDYCASHADQIKPGVFLMVCVSDTGLGMDEQTRSRMFEPFFTTKSKGLGMGLAAVYGTVRNHLGTINVYSEPGRGTAVKLYLPLLGEADAAEPRAEREPELEPSSGGRILLVDDEPLILNATTAMLKRLGYR